MAASQADILLSAQEIAELRPQLTPMTPEQIDEEFDRVSAGKRAVWVGSEETCSAESLCICRRCGELRRCPEVSMPTQESPCRLEAHEPYGVERTSPLCPRLCGRARLRKR